MTTLDHTLLIRAVRPMRWLYGLLRAPVAVLAVGLALAGMPAHAVPVGPGLEALLRFELAAAPLGSPLGIDLSGNVIPMPGVVPQPPFDNMTFQFFTALSDDIDAGDAFQVQAFDMAGAPVSEAVSLAFASATGGGFEGTFSGPAPIGQFGTLGSTQGYLRVMNVVGTFDLTAFRVQAHPVSGPLVTTGWVVGQSIELQQLRDVTVVPEPNSVALLAGGLVALFTIRRRALPPLLASRRT